MEYRESVKKDSTESTKEEKEDKEKGIRERAGERVI